MFNYGYCYGGSTGYSGYRPYGVIETKKEAEEAIRSHLPGQKVTFVESGDKCRAYADGERTGYIYFSVKHEVWAAFDDFPKLLFSGSLTTVKKKVREFLEKEHTDCDKIKSVRYNGRKRSQEVSVTYADSGDTLCKTGITIVRIV